VSEAAEDVRRVPGQGQEGGQVLQLRQAVRVGDCELPGTRRRTLHSHCRHAAVESDIELLIFFAC